jgi:hypothetical protein
MRKELLCNSKLLRKLIQSASKSLTHLFKPALGKKLGNAGRVIDLAQAAKRQRKR